MKKIVVLIPTYNRKEQLIQLLKQLLVKGYYGQYTFEIVVVVDGSQDGTLETLEKEFKQIHVVKGNGNWWYTKSMNEGFKYADKLNPHFVLTLNDDIKLESDYLQKMIKAIHQSPSNSIIGSVSLTENNPHKLLFSGIKKIKWWRMKLVRYHELFEQIDIKQQAGIYKSIALPGRGTLIPFSIIKELKMFDAQFLQYHSDYDFCLRARKKGYCTVISWEAINYSYAAQTSASTSYLKSSLNSFIKSFFQRNSRIFILDHIRFISRHGNKILIPITFLIFILASFKAHFFNKKLNEI
ncbi:MAG: glycosyltransferase family 2 protein [Sphingobacteriaceae bacterium]|nr:glycosyltransferase family 2 protein [Sphingobacteriaceae bacterium]